MIKINFKGGTVSLGSLNHLVAVLDMLKIPHVSLGQRQNLFIDAPEHLNNLCEAELDDRGFELEVNCNNYPNIISSYVTEDVFSTHPWVSEGMYREALESLTYKPKLKVNIVDPTQGIIPIFTGNINFVCSKSLNFWYVYVKHVSIDGMQLYPYLIYTTEIGKFCKLLEIELTKQTHTDLQSISNYLNSQHTLISTEVSEDLSLGRIRFPHYEGMVNYGGKNWLGVYRRNNNFSTELLIGILDLCLEQNIAELYITPWQTLAIKGISESNRIAWEKLLGKHGINIRHSALELNWQIPDTDKEASELKMFLVRQFDEHDIRTYGLTFAVKTKAMEIASSIIIEKRNGEESFNVLFAEDFNPNKQKYNVYAEEVKKDELVFVLERLSRKYYEQLNTMVLPTEVVNKKTEKNLSKEVMQCSVCFTVYDPDFGDELNNIPKGILFQALPESYCCPVCSSGKTKFSMIALQMAQ